MTRASAVLTSTLVALAACRGPARPTPATAPVGRTAPAVSAGASGHPPPPRADGRLPPTATPERYSLALRIDPAQPRYSGTTTIDVTVGAPTSYIVLHARDMNIHSAVVHLGRAVVAAAPSLRLAHAGVVPEELVLTLATPLPEGPATIEITYDAPFASDLAGLYRIEEAGRMYAYTQFEVADARRAFPCFDEPGFKTPYDVTIEAPRTMTVVTNSPQASPEESPNVGRDVDRRLVAHRFVTTPPLPSYLVAFAVGDFDVVQGQKEPFPIRALTTKGRGGLTGLALETAASLVAALGEYFDLPYPYPKLDLVAVPDFAAGAMENAGLITFRDTLLLLDPRRASVSARRLQAIVIAHELAHHWFGDLVTLQWWDDIWLNEGFATWAEARIVDTWRPSFGATLEQIAGVQHVMDTDALKSARAVREPVNSKSDAEEAFDGLTYDKGAALLRMIESWLGRDVFRRGVQRYLRQHAWKNARADDLFEALEFVSTQRVGQMASDFLDQPGVPEVVVRWTCGTAAGNKLELSQREWRPLGSTIGDGTTGDGLRSAGGGAPRGWRLPVCIDSDGQKAKSCFTLGRELIVRDLGPSCPGWVHPNADEAGYYRFVLDGARLMALGRAARSMSAADRLGLVSNAWAEVRQGAIQPSALFDLLSTFDGESNRYVVEQIAATLQAIDASLVDDDTRGAFQRWVTARMAPHKAALGWEPSANEDDDRAAMRRAVLSTMGELGGDRATLDEAEEYAGRWLRDPTAIPSDTAAAALSLASMGAGAARLSQLRSAADHSKSPEDRVLAIRAMGTFDDPSLLRKALDLALTGDLRLSELKYLFGSAAGHRAARPVLYAWEKENWGKLGARLSGSFGRGMLVAVAAGMCTRAELDDAAAFFPPALHGVEGVQRQLDEALESAALCVALRDRGAADVARYLKSR